MSLVICDSHSPDHAFGPHFRTTSCNNPRSAGGGGCCIVSRKPVLRRKDAAPVVPVHLIKDELSPAQLYGMLSGR